MQVRSALIQAKATRDKQSMIEKNVGMIREAAGQGARIICLQEIFFGPYFCQVQDARWYDSAEPIPGPTIDLMQEVARKHDVVLIVPIYEREMAGVYYNTAVVIDADGAILGKYRKNHIPQVNNFWEKFYFRPGNLGYPTFQTQYARIGVYICYDRHFPEGARALGLNGAEIVYNPSATIESLSRYLWELEQPAHAAANGYFVGALNRVGVEEHLGFGPGKFYGSSYFCNPRGQIMVRGSDSEDDIVVADLDLDMIKEVRDLWQFYRDRRPDTYEALVAQ